MLRERLLTTTHQPPDGTLPTATSKRRTFEDVLDLPEEQLRGISLTTLLTACSNLFARHGAAAREDPHGTFALSRQHDSLDYFCSHSWATSRWLKYVALLVHFNLGSALMATMICNCVCANVSLWCPHLVPWMAYPIQPDNANGLAPLTAEIMLAPVFVTVLCTAHRFFPSRSLFLDIACIRQDSDTAKADGIAALGAVLDRSQRMLVLCDAHYFSRLWCTFELAAYTKREGGARIDLLPLHEPLVTLSLLLDLICFSVFGVVLGAAIELFDRDDLAALGQQQEAMPFFVLLLHAPAQLFVVVAQVEACRMRAAVAELRRFKVEEARCHSDADREELLKLIARWFAGAEADEDARRVGFHRFETYVRHAVAPNVAQSQGFYARLLLAAGVILTAPLFDTICSRAFTPNHLLGALSTATLLVSLAMPFYLLVYAWSARVVLALREKCAWPAALSYSVGVLLNNVALVGWMGAWTLAGPTQLFAPDYRLPQQDVLDETGRRLLASNLTTVVTGLAVLAIAAVFKF